MFPEMLYLHSVSAPGQLQCAILVLALGKKVSFTWLDVYGNHFILLAAHDLIGQRGERGTHTGHLGFLFKATSDPAFENPACSLGRKECVLARPGLLGTFGWKQQKMKRLTDGPVVSTGWA